MKKFQISKEEKKWASQGDQASCALWFKSEFSEFHNSENLMSAYDAILDAFGIMYLFHVDYVTYLTVAAEAEVLFATFRYRDKKVWKLACEQWKKAQHERGRSTSADQLEQLVEFITQMSNWPVVTEKRYSTLRFAKTFKRLVVHYCIECNTSSTDVALNDYYGRHICQRCLDYLGEIGCIG